jgi:hypothetical protein
MKSALEANEEKGQEERMEADGKDQNYPVAMSGD